MSPLTDVSVDSRPSHAASAAGHPRVAVRSPSGVPLLALYLADRNPRSTPLVLDPHRRMAAPERGCVKRGGDAGLAGAYVVVALFLALTIWSGAEFAWWERALVVFIWTMLIPTAIVLTSMQDGWAASMLRRALRRRRRL